MMTRFFGSIGLLLLCAGLSQAQAPHTQIAMVSAAAKPASVARGGKGVLTLTVTVAPGFHINANRPNDPDLIATTFTGTAPAGIKFGAPRFPAFKSVKVSYSKLPLLVYMGRAVIDVPFIVSRNAHPSRATLAGSLTYQGCNATACFPPRTVPFQASVMIK